MALLENLKQTRHSLKDFIPLTRDLLTYFPNVISSSKSVKGYLIQKSISAGTVKYTRPINSNLFIADADVFLDKVNLLCDLLKSLKEGTRFLDDDEHLLINSTLYTIQQAIGAGFDLLSNPNSARKHVGNRFEELIRSVFVEIGIANNRTVLKIPYELDSEVKSYKCENDIILSPYTNVQSDASHIDTQEVVVSVKTTSKDRMGKMFVDKLLLENFTKKKQKVIGIFHNDVQRKGQDSISYTLVSGLFLVYTQFLTPLEGIYYLDLPPKASESPYDKHLKPFSTLLSKDVWNLLGT